MNLRGAAVAGRVQLLTILLKLEPLAVIVALAANPPVPVNAARRGCGSDHVWGFLGVESATVPAERIADARRTVPRLTLIGTAATGAVYLLVPGAIALLMPRAAVAASPAPVAAFVLWLT